MNIDYHAICVANGIISYFGVLIDFFDLSEIRPATEQEIQQYKKVNHE